MPRKRLTREDFNAVELTTIEQIADLISRMDPINQKHAARLLGQVNDYMDMIGPLQSFTSALMFLARHHEMSRVRICRFLAQQAEQLKEVTNA